ncbi:MAG: hypothetical protein HYV40_00860 [Candidatus Levybacteria bacterium]|nr:hypothetical protein [Candidatus Levybacteria bacterium]
MIEKLTPAGIFDEARAARGEYNQEALILHGMEVYDILSGENEAERATTYQDLLRRLSDPQSCTTNPYLGIAERLTPLGLQDDSVPTLERVVLATSDWLRDELDPYSEEKLKAFLQGMSAAAFTYGRVAFGTRVGHIGTNGDLRSSEVIMVAIEGLSLGTQGAIRYVGSQPEAIRSSQV